MRTHVKQKTNFLPDFSSPRRAFRVLLLAFVLFYALIAYRENGFEPLYPARADLSLHVAMALHMKDPSLFYPKDPFFPAYRDFYPPTFAHFLSLFPDCRLPLLALSALLSLVILTGVYFFSVFLTGHTLFSLLIALLTLKTWPALCSVQWGGILPEFVAPRTFVVATAPWLFLAMLSWKTLGRRALLAFLLGALCNVHPMAAQLFFVWIASLAILERRNWKKFLKALGVTSGLFFLAAAAHLVPVVTYILRAFVGGSATRTRSAPLVERLYDVHHVPLSNIASILFYLGPIAALSLYGYMKKERSENDRRVAVLVWIIAGLSIVFQMLAAISPRLNAAELPRLFVYLYLFFFTYSYFGLRALSRWKKAFAIFALGAMMLHHGSTYRTVLAAVAPESGLYRIFAQPPRQTWVNEDFLSLAEYAKTQTPKDAFFLVPPFGMFSLWRTYAERSIVVHWEGVYRTADWEIFTRVRDAYSRPEAIALYDLAQDYGATYVVSEVPLFPPAVGLRLVAERGPYQIFQVK